MQAAKNRLRTEMRTRLQRASGHGSLAAQDDAVCAAFMKLVRRRAQAGGSVGRLGDGEAAGGRLGGVEAGAPPAEWRSGERRRIGMYVSCERLREVDTLRILKVLLPRGDEFRVYVPLVGETSGAMRMLHVTAMSCLRQKAFGILEPSEEYSASEGAVDGADAVDSVTNLQGAREDIMQVDGLLEMLVVPGVAFDRSGHRLGRGGGYGITLTRAAWIASILFARVMRGRYTCVCVRLFACVRGSLIASHSTAFSRDRYYDKFIKESESRAIATGHVPPLTGTMIKQ